ALSIRADLIAPAYITALTNLQDRVPPFPTAEARRIIEEDFGRPLDQIFSSLSEEPVAAASLGQVYRGVLRQSGKEVAVKVQRPGTLERICVDLLLLRAGAGWVKASQNLNSDLVGLASGCESNLTNWHPLLCPPPPAICPRAIPRRSTTGAGDS
ncbi:MAG: hypothetical protein SGPRY_015033, partial [Prymnesium sp.]